MHAAEESECLDQCWNKEFLAAFVPQKKPLNSKKRIIQSSKEKLFKQQKACTWHACKEFAIWHVLPFPFSSSKSDLLEGIRVSLYSDQTDSGEIGYYFSLDSIIAADSSSLFHLWPRPLPPLQTRRSMAACHLQLTMMQSCKQSLG